MFSDVNFMEVMYSTFIKGYQSRGFPSIFSYYNTRNTYLAIHMDNNEHLDPRDNDWNQIMWN